MVSNANDDFPDPDRPVNTISAFLGRSRCTFLRLCSRAPRMTRRSVVLMGSVVVTRSLRSWVLWWLLTVGGDASEGRRFGWREPATCVGACGYQASDLPRWNLSAPPS